jgi:hypothetical protein
VPPRESSLNKGGLAIVDYASHVISPDRVVPTPVSVDAIEVRPPRTTKTPSRWASGAHHGIRKQYGHRLGGEPASFTGNFISDGTDSGNRDVSPGSSGIGPQAEAGRATVCVPQVLAPLPDTIQGAVAECRRGQLSPARRHWHRLPRHSVGTGMVTGTVAPFPKVRTLELEGCRA